MSTTIGGSSASVGPSKELLAAVNGSTTKTAVDSATDTQDRFMKLLVTQMKNQDPLNPMDNAQVTSQMAQLSTVTGIDKVNATLQSMMSSTASGQSFQAASMIGHAVMVAGNTTALSSGKALLGVDLKQTADNVTVTVRDSAGNAVQTMNLGKQAVGQIPLAWDGKTDKGTTAPDGTYTFDVVAKSGNTKVDASTLTIGSVSSVSTGTAGIKLNLDTGKSVAMTDVLQII
jgi:flagellar basal-body rod modification protein FlgD